MFSALIFQLSGSVESRYTALIDIPTAGACRRKGKRRRKRKQQANYSKCDRLFGSYDAARVPYSKRLIPTDCSRLLLFI